MTADNDIWIKMFDGNNRRSTERQLCLLRDRAVLVHETWCRWKHAVERGSAEEYDKQAGKWVDVPVEEWRKRLDDAIRPLFRDASEAEILLSGILIGREQASLK